MKTRDEHIDWCKKRALEYLDHQQPMEALTSMLSDLTKHPETKHHVGIQLAVELLVIGSLRDPREARRFIEGFR